MINTGITDEQIEAAKKVHKNVYLATLSWDDEEKKSHSVEVLYRVPSVADIEMFSKTAATEPLVSAKNLFISVLVTPEWGVLAEKMEGKPAVINAFVEKELSPFFGVNIRTTSRKV